MHMLPFFVGGIIFVLIGAVQAVFCRRWSALSVRFENYINMPESKRRSKPLNFLIVGIAWALVGAGWIIIALLNQPWR
ncbi:MAG: hypothetical protein ABIO06_08405 [Pseudolysinimonas sp.]